MININSVYQKVLAITNKEQRGYITPQEFNLFANQAQMEIFEQYFYDLNQFNRIPGNDTPYADVDTMLEEKLQIFESFDERTTVNVQANSLEEATKKMKESSLVAQNKEHAIRRQKQDGTPSPRLVVKSIVKNPNTPNQKIIKETAFQKDMRARENKEFIQKTGDRIKRQNISPQKLFRDGLITYQDKLKLQKQMGHQRLLSRGVGQNPLEDKSFGFPKPDLIDIFDPTTKAGNKFKIYNDGGIVKGKNGGMVRQCKPKARMF